MLNDFAIVGEIVGCEYPFHINRYIDNLVRLGLFEKATLASLTDKLIYEPIKNHLYIKQFIQRVQELRQEDEYNKPNIVESYVFLTSFGKSFCEICIDS